MKSLVFAMALCALLCTGCIDVIRGYKSFTYIKVDGESKMAYTANPEMTVAADKDYTDSFKTNTDVSSSKSTSKSSAPKKEESDPQKDDDSDSEDSDEPVDDLEGEL